MSNGTLEWSDCAVQPPVAWILHLEPSVARLGRELKCSIQRVYVAPRAIWAGLGLGRAGASQWVSQGFPAPLPSIPPPHPSVPPRATPRGENVTKL